MYSSILSQFKDVDTEDLALCIYGDDPLLLRLLHNEFASKNAKYYIDASKARNAATAITKARDARANDDETRVYLRADIAGALKLANSILSARVVSRELWDDLIILMYKPHNRAKWRQVALEMTRYISTPAARDYVYVPEIIGDELEALYNLQFAHDFIIGPPPDRGQFILDTAGSLSRANITLTKQYSGEGGIGHLRVPGPVSLRASAMRRIIELIPREFAGKPAILENPENFNYGIIMSPVERERLIEFARELPFNTNYFIFASHRARAALGLAANEYTIEGKYHLLPIVYPSADLFAYTAALEWSGAWGQVAARGSEDFAANCVQIVAQVIAGDRLVYPLSFEHQPQYIREFLTMLVFIVLAIIYTFSRNKDTFTHYYPAKKEIYGAL